VKNKYLRAYSFVQFWTGFSQFSQLISTNKKNTLKEPEVAVAQFTSLHTYNIKAKNLCKVGAWLLNAHAIIATIVLTSPQQQILYDVQFLVLYYFCPRAWLLHLCDGSLAWHKLLLSKPNTNLLKSTRNHHSRRVLFLLLPLYQNNIIFCIINS